MTLNYINPSHIAEEYELRLQESARNARNARFRRSPRESVMRQKLGRLIIGLGELVHGQRPSTGDDPTDGLLATN